MARIKTSYLVVTNFTKGRGLNHQTSEMCTNEDWKKALSKLDKDCRPTRQNVLSNGSIPNPVPLYWCEDCGCWVLSKKHDHDRSRVPHTGDVWEEDCTHRIIPCSADYDGREHIDWDTDPRVITTPRSIIMKVTKVENNPGFGAFEYNGIKYQGMAPHVAVHYTRTLTGDWNDDSIFHDAEKVENYSVRLSCWRKTIRAMILQ